MTNPDSPEGLTVEELARLKALAEAGHVIGPHKGLALISQVERLTAERDGAILRADRESRTGDALMKRVDELWAETKTLKARADTLAAENARLREALEPFRLYAVDQLERRLPRAIAADDCTPVWGMDDGDPTIYVGDLRKVAALSVPSQEGGT